MKQYIAYYRVSTQKQGRSGLGLEAQKEAVTRFTSHSGTVIAEFTDVESGKSDNRPQLLKALEAAQKNKATLLIAKLDRLSRNVTFISTLMDTGVRFVCCDMPEANELTIHLMAALAQWERKRIAERIKDALQAKKSRGETLGNVRNLTGRLLGPAAMKSKAATNPNNVRSKAFATSLRRTGKTLKEIAAELNANGFVASAGGQFNAEQVSRLLKREAVSQ